MKRNIQQFLFCPVPDEQKPINQYIDLKEIIGKKDEIKRISSAMSSSSLLIKKRLFFTLFFLVLLFISFNIFNIFSYKTDEVQNYVMIGLIGLMFFILIKTFKFLFFYFLPGKEIQKRFYQSYLIYEESSWYNSEIWKKPISLIKSDRFLGSQLYFFEKEERNFFFPFFFIISFLLRKKIRK
jgi:hypothetical protein